ncbi:hypothetical protein ANN_12951 [Periplaneta americana]|uniref:Uncharacterized protein n=1 Tax=Periplaneta americana TaxID=6978 RepID=A0ABQ8TJW3_PERAM|nr:hypothetical protein ANN_12951 [Periplaneta americana]
MVKTCIRSTIFRPHEVVDCIVSDLVAIKPQNEKLDNICDCLVDTYVADDITFPPPIRAAKTASLQRKTNALDSPKFDRTELKVQSNKGSGCGSALYSLSSFFSFIPSAVEIYAVNWLPYRIKPELWTALGSKNSWAVGTTPSQRKIESAPNNSNAARPLLRRPQLCCPGLKKLR